MGRPPISNKYLQVHSFYLEKEKMRTYNPDFDLLGLCQIWLGQEPSLLIAIQKKRGCQNTIYLQRKDLDKKRMNLLALALIPVPKKEKEQENDSTNTAG